MLSFWIVFRISSSFLITLNSFVRVIICAKLLLQRALTSKHYIRVARKVQKHKKNKEKLKQFKSHRILWAWFHTYKRHVCSPRTKCIPMQGDIKSNSPWHTGSQTILMLHIQTSNDLYWQKIVLYRDGSPSNWFIIHLKYRFLSVFLCKVSVVYTRESSTKEALI